MEFKPDTRLWANKVRHLTPYVPGEQPIHDNLCKLNTNENPFPPSPKVSEAIMQVAQNQADALRLYPDPESSHLRETIAKVYQVDVNQVFVGNGSDEVLALVFASFFIKERPLLAPDISYSFYPVYAETFGIELVKIPLREDFSINTNDYRQPCSGIIIANPNAPTGLLLSLESIRKLVEEHPNGVIVIDEAYIDFAASDLSTNDPSSSDLSSQDKEPVSAVSLINEFDNLIVTQTFSKSRSLAGLRVGMAFANPSLIEALTRVKNSFNSYPIDRIAQAGAVASLEDNDYFQDICQKVIALREELAKQLTDLSFEVVPSQANFLFVRPENGNAAEIVQDLREEGVIVRHFDKPRINEYMRISVGTADQNKHFIETLTKILKQQNA